MMHPTLLRWEDQYLNHLGALRHHGEVRENRTGIPTQSIFAPPPIVVDLTAGFPAMLTKRINWHAARTELLWMLRGGSSTDYLHQHRVHIWDSWADQDGDLGRVYGVQWRNFGGPVDGHDQLEALITSLITDPYSRRHVVTAWHPTDRKALEPCPMFFQCNVREGWWLDMHMYQRSADWFLGVPFDIAEYAALVHILASFTGYTAGKLTISYGDSHLYVNHLEQADEQLARSHPWSGRSQIQPTLSAPWPTMGEKLNRWLTRIDPYDLIINDYHPRPGIKAPIAV